MSKKKVTSDQNDLARSVMQSIQDDNIKMHSHWYFMALSGVSVLSVFLTSVMAAVFVNLTVRDIEYADARGLRHLANDNEIISAFPWLLALLAVTAVVSTVMLARKLEFAYKFKQYVFFGGMIGFLIALGVGMSVIGVVERLEDADPFRSLQTLRSRADDSILHGNVTAIDNGYIELKIDSGVVVVTLDESTRYKPGVQPVTLGQEIGVFGEEMQDGSWKAIVIGTKPPRIKDLSEQKVKGLRDFRPVPN